MYIDKWKTKKITEKGVFAERLSKSHQKASYLTECLAVCLVAHITVLRFTV